MADWSKVIRATTFSISSAGATLDEWTDSLLLSDRHAEVTVPSLTIAGWHDLLLAADLEILRARDR